MISKKWRMAATFILGAVLVVGLLSLTGCSGDLKEEAKQKATELAKDAGDIAGEMTASWLGTTGSNFEEGFDKTIVKRLEYLEISLDNVTYKDKGKTKTAAIELTISNNAPTSEKMYLNPLFDDNHYLVACDQNGYTYSVYLFADREKYLEDRHEFDGVIKPGKSRVTVYTEIPAADTINSMLFIGKTISK